MIAQVVRSGVVEAVHEGAVAAVRTDGSVLLSHGDINRRCYLRSAAKPFQAFVTRRLGPPMPDEFLALASASHGGQPVHVAIVGAMLDEVGLTTAALRCPPAWPMIDEARDRVIARGHSRPRREFHNCSGKHAAMLRACVHQGWPLDTYLDPDHPLQLAIRVELERVMGSQLDEPGVDGCGAPVWQGSVAELARANAVLGSDPDYRPIWSAMHRFAPLTSDGGESMAGLARWADVAAKGGAEGLLGVATRHDVGVAVKAWDGSGRPLGVAAHAALSQLGFVSPGTSDRLLAELTPAVLGGGNPVGTVEATVGGT